MFLICPMHTFLDFSLLAPSLPLSPFSFNLLTSPISGYDGQYDHHRSPRATHSNVFMNSS